MATTPIYADEPYAVLQVVQSTQYYISAGAAGYTAGSFQLSCMPFTPTAPNDECVNLIQLIADGTTTYDPKIASNSLQYAPYRDVWYSYAFSSLILLD